MPFNPSAMTNLMMQKMSSYRLHGSKTMPLLSATSSAVCSYLPAAAVVMSTNVVTGPGSGTYTGKIIGCNPSAMSSLMILKASSSGIVGKDLRRIFDAVSFGVCQTLLTTALAQGTVIGGGPGAGQGKIMSLVPSTLEKLIITNLYGRRLHGSKTMPMFLAIAFGVCNHIMTAATIITTCVGAFFPPPVGPIIIPNAPGPGRLI